MAGAAGWPGRTCRGAREAAAQRWNRDEQQSGDQHEVEEQLTSQPLRISGRAVGYQHIERCGGTHPGTTPRRNKAALDLHEAETKKHYRSEERNPAQEQSGGRVQGGVPAHHVRGFRARRPLMPASRYTPHWQRRTPAASSAAEATKYTMVSRPIP